MSEFAKLAAAFCEEIEKGVDESRSGSDQRMVHLLAQLIATATTLRQVDLDQEYEELEGIAISGEEYERIRQKISENHREWGYYWVIPMGLFDVREVPDAVLGDVVDDLADIWRELKRGLRILEQGGVYESVAVWHWRFSFHAHWGRHAADALRVMLKKDS